MCSLELWFCSCMCVCACVCACACACVCVCVIACACMCVGGGVLVFVGVCQGGWLGSEALFFWVIVSKFRIFP